MKAIELHSISFTYENGQDVFSDFSLAINSNEFVFLIGANGSGKTTLFKLLLGALKPINGSILYNSEKITGISILAKHIGYVPQSLGVDPEMYIRDSLNLVGSLHGLTGVNLSERVDALLLDLGLDQVGERRIKKLSGGQQQLVNIALALLHNPAMLLLDEPFVGLDFGTKSNLIAYLKSLNKTILCISHDIDLAETSADKILFLKNGTIKEFASPAEIIKNNPQYYVQVDCAEIITLPKFSDKVKVNNLFNRITFSCANEIESVQEINDFLNENESRILSKAIYKNSLKSTLVGLYDLSFATDKKNRKRKNKK